MDKNPNPKMEAVEVADESNGRAHEGTPYDRLEGRLQALYRSEINFSIGCFYDSGFEIKLGDPMNGYKDEIQLSDYSSAVDWLWQMARRHYPKADCFNI